MNGLINRVTVLCSLHIKSYDGSKTDLTETDSLISSTGAAANAARVTKNLFTDCPELRAIKLFNSATRTEFYKRTTLWDDNGDRIIPVTRQASLDQWLAACKHKHSQLVSDFLDVYDMRVSAQAFKLGSMFNRADYLDRSAVAKRFIFKYGFKDHNPGHFVLNMEQKAIDELQHQFQLQQQERIDSMYSDLWERLHERLTNMSTALTDKANGKPTGFHQTLVTHAVDLCDMLKDFNVANDPKLEAARRTLADAMQGVTYEALKKEPNTRAVLKKQIDDLNDALGM